MAEPKKNKGDPVAKKKVVIFAEAKPYVASKYQMNDPDFDSDKLPGELKEIYNRYQNIGIEHEKAVNDEWQQHENSGDGNQSELSDNIKEITNRWDKVHDEWINHPLNPEIEKEDNAFKIEGNKLKSYYNKQGINAEVLPVYEKDSSLIKEKIKNLNPQDDVALLGHSGDIMAGLPLEWWNENLSKGKQENCYLGTCYGQQQITPELPDVRNLHSTKNSYWWGVNPEGDNLMDAMYSAVRQDSISPQPIYGQDYVTSNPSGKPGRASFDIPNYAKGGTIMANLKNLKRKKKLPGGGDVDIKDTSLGNYKIGTPLKEIYNIPADMSEQAKLMSFESTKNRMNQIRWANFEGKLTDYPKGQGVPVFRSDNPKIALEMERRGLTKEYIDSWQPSNYPKEFGVGGDILSGAASGALTGMALGPWGSAAGAVVGGVAGWLGGRGEEEDELVENYIVPQGLASQHYQRAAAGADLTEFVGPRHEDGGIALGGLPVEVEGGETRTGNMIHSDRDKLKITSAMIRKYPVLKKSDKGKTMAQITKREHKKFEKREWDELNDNAAEITMLPYEEISEMLSLPEGQIMEDGGDISASKAREILSHGAIRGKPITAKQRRFFGAKSKAAGGFNLQNVGKYAPLVTSGIDMIGSLIGGPEEVDYGRTSFTPTKVNYASAEPGVQRIRRSYGNAEAKLKRMNPNRYMSRINELAAGEADAVTGHAGQIQGMNVQAANRANILDAQNATRVNMFNKQVGMSEAQANAANRGAWRGRMSANLANIGTIGGQMSRDERLQESSDAARDRYFEILEEQNRILGGYGDDDLEEEDIFTNVDPLSATPNYPLYARGGDLTHRLRLRNFKSA